MSTQTATSVPSKRLLISILSTDLAFIPNNILSWVGIVDGTTNLTSADFGTRAFGVFRNSTNTQMELFEFDPTTIASASVTIISRGLSFSGGTTANAAPAYDWNANETIIELGSHTPQLFEQYLDKTSDQTIAGLITFSQAPIGINPGGQPDASTTVKGISKMSTAPALSTNPIAVGDNDPRVPTQNENDALVGTSGTGVSSANKLVDAADVSNAAVADKVVRASGTALPALDGHLLTAITNYQVFTGSGTWTKPSGVSANSYVLVQAWGGGGGGGGGRITTSGVGAGGGGAGGSYIEAKFRLSDLGATVTVTVGAGGAGGSLGGNGQVGGNTTFGSLLTAYGGAGGNEGLNGSAGAGASGGGSLAAGNTAGAGGGPAGGAYASTGGDSSFGGGGGSSTATNKAGSSAYGGGGSTIGSASGGSAAGGDSVYGGGGGGSGNVSSNTAGGIGKIFGGNGGTGGGSNSVDVAGTSGTAPAGGGGGSIRNTSGNTAGGNGARGEVRVWVIAGI